MSCWSTNPSKDEVYFNQIYYQITPIINCKFIKIEIFTMLARADQIYGVLTEQLQTCIDMLKVRLNYVK